MQKQIITSSAICIDYSNDFLNYHIIKKFLLFFIFFNLFFKKIKKFKKLFVKIYKYDLNTHDLLKILALLLMIIDHTGFYILNDYQALRVVGRLSFPIFSILYGYHFKNKINIKLLIYGIPLIILNYILYQNIIFNILYSFFLSSLLLYIYNNTSKIHKLDKLFFLLLLILLHPIINIYLDYGLFGFFFMLTANQKNKKMKTISFILVFFAYYIMQYLNFSFNFINSIFLFVLLFIEATLLYYYQNNTISYKNNLTEIYIKLFARYSLEIFIIQAIFFEIWYNLF